MQQLNSLDYSQFLARAESGSVTVGPRLAREVMRTRLVPTRFKRELLRSTEATETSIIIDCARESELFYDIMVDLGVIVVHDTA